MVQRLAGTAAIALCASVLPATSATAAVDRQDRIVVRVDAHFEHPGYTDDWQIRAKRNRLGKVSGKMRLTMAGATVEVARVSCLAVGADGGVVVGGEVTATSSEVIWPVVGWFLLADVVDGDSSGTGGDGSRGAAFLRGVDELLCDPHTFVGNGLVQVTDGSMDVLER